MHDPRKYTAAWWTAQAVAHEGNAVAMLAHDSRLPLGDPDSESARLGTLAIQAYADRQRCLGQIDRCWAFLAAQFPEVMDQVFQLEHDALALLAQGNDFDTQARKASRNPQAPKRPRGRPRKES